MATANDYKVVSGALKKINENEAYIATFDERQSMKAVLDEQNERTSKELTKKHAQLKH